VYGIDMSEEQINIKTVKTVEKFPVIYDYSSPGHSKTRLIKLGTQFKKKQT
jgi:hypothetical protein